MDGSTGRQTFDGLGFWERGLWYALAAVSTAIFLWGCARLWRRWRAGRRDAAARPDVRRAARLVLTQAAIGRGHGLVGLAHAFVFYGFLVLFAGTVVLAFQDHVAGPVGWHFWRGAFYDGYSLFLDVFGALLLIGLLAFVVRRGSGRARQLDLARADGRPLSPARSRARLDAWTFLWSLVFLGVSGFLLEALRIAADDPAGERWAPIGHLAGALLRDLGLDPGTADAARAVTWWIHGVVALAFVAAIPFTKATHMLTGPAATAVRAPDVSRRLPDEPAGGYATLAAFDERHLIDLDACTTCGRCHDVCPARTGGMPLSPRDVILDLRDAAAAGHDGPLVPDVLAAPALWSCMQCNACVEVCPVGIEQLPIINLSRRALLERGELDPLLQGALERVASTGNSFGEPRRKRARWTKELDFELADARREGVDVLWYVGDFASFDPRNQRATRQLAALLHRAGVDVGILREGERTAGNDVRRAGEEGLFRSLAEENAAAIAACSFQRILTSDPHTFNTLRNEYPALGASWRGEQVVHHTQLLLELLEVGALAIDAPLSGRATYHDPCTLGRLNGVFEPPRELIRRTGLELVEMGRNREGSLCCGAGGGRIWMQDTAAPGSRRVSEQRIDEAVALDGVELFVVACPKDVTMYEDAIRTSGHADRIELRELTELVAAAVGAPVAVAG